MLAEILEIVLHAVAQVIAHAARHADAARLGNSLQPCRDVDAVAENVAILDHHVADIDADAKQHPALLGQRFVGLGERLLDGNGSAHRVDDAREFGKHAVAGRAGDLAASVCNELVDDGATCRERGERALLIVMHEARIAHDVGGHDGHKLAFEGRRFRLGHGAPRRAVERRRRQSSLPGAPRW